MLLTGHLAAARAIALAKPQYSGWTLYLGSILPDLIDKPLAYSPLVLPLLGELPKRGIGHSLLFVVVLFLITRSWPLTLGILSHLILDAITGAVPLLYPLSPTFLDRKFFVPMRVWLPMEGLLFGAVVVWNSIKKRTSQTAKTLTSETAKASTPETAKAPILEAQDA